MKQNEILVAIKKDTEYIKSELTEMKEKVSTNDNRITKLERWQSYVLGGAAVAGMFITMAWVYIKDKLRG